jgi:hypothetical protein
LGQTSKGLANGENRNSVTAEEKDERTESESKPTHPGVDEPTVNGEKNTTGQPPEDTESTPATDPETAAHEDKAVDSDAAPTQPAEPEEHKDEPSAPTSPKEPSEDPEDVRAREEIARLNAELMQAAAEEESKSTPAYADEHPAPDQAKENPSVAETKAQGADGEAAEPEILEPKDVSASDEEDTEHTKPTEANEDGGVPEVSEATPIEAHNAEAEIPADQMIEKEASDMPEENIPESVKETAPDENDDHAPELVKEGPPKLSEPTSVEIFESTSPDSKESENTKDTHNESQADSTIKGPVVTELAPLPTAPVEDPEDVRAREEIARLNAELLAAAAKDDLPSEQEAGDNSASPKAPETHEKSPVSEEITHEQPVEATPNPAESNASLDSALQPEANGSPTEVPSEELGSVEHSTHADEPLKTVTEDELEVVKETAHEEPAVEARAFSVEDHPVKDEAVITEDSTASHTPEDVIAGENESLAHEDHVFDKPSRDGGADVAQHNASTPNHEEGVLAEQTGSAPVHQQEAASEVPLAAEESHSPEHKESIHEHEVETKTSRDVASETEVAEHGGKSDDQISEHRPDELTAHSLPAAVEPRSKKGEVHQEPEFGQERGHQEEEKSIDSRPAIETQYEDRDISPALEFLETDPQTDHPSDDFNHVTDEDNSSTRNLGFEDAQHNDDGENEVLDNEPKFHEEVQEPTTSAATSRTKQSTQHLTHAESNESYEEPRSRRESAPEATHQIPDPESSVVDKHEEYQHPPEEDSVSEQHKSPTSDEVEIFHPSGTDQEVEFAENDDHRHNLDGSAVEVLEENKAHENSFEPQAKSVEDTERLEDTEIVPTSQVETSTEHSRPDSPEEDARQSGLTESDIEEHMTPGEVGENRDSHEHAASAHAELDPAHPDDKNASTGDPALVENQGPVEAIQQPDEHTNIQDAALHHNDVPATKDTDNHEQDLHEQVTGIDIEQPTQSETLLDGGLIAEQAVHEESENEEQISLPPLVNIPEDHPVEDFTVPEAEEIPSSAQLRESFSQDESLTPMEYGEEVDPHELVADYAHDNDQSPESVSRGEFVTPMEYGDQQDPHDILAHYTSSHANSWQEANEQTIEDDCAYTSEPVTEARNPYHDHTIEESHLPSTVETTIERPMTPVERQIPGHEYAESPATVLNADDLFADDDSDEEDDHHSYHQEEESKNEARKSWPSPDPEIQEQDQSRDVDVEQDHDDFDRHPPTHRSSGLFASLVDTIRSDVPLLGHIVGGTSAGYGQIEGEDRDYAEEEVDDSHITGQFDGDNHDNQSHEPDSGLHIRTHTADTIPSFESYAHSEDSSTSPSEAASSPFEEHLPAEPSIRTSWQYNSRLREAVEEGSHLGLKPQASPLHEEFDPYNSQTYPNYITPKGSHADLQAQDTNADTIRAEYSPRSSSALRRNFPSLDTSPFANTTQAYDSPISRTNSLSSQISLPQDRSSSPTSFPSRLPRRPTVSDRLSTSTNFSRTPVSSPSIPSNHNSFFQKTRSLFEQQSSPQNSPSPPPVSRPLSGLFTVGRRPQSPTTGSPSPKRTSTSRPSSLYISDTAKGGIVPKSLDKDGKPPSPAFSLHNSPSRKTSLSLSRQNSNTSEYNEKRASTSFLSKRGLVPGAGALGSAGLEDSIHNPFPSPTRRAEKERLLGRTGGGGGL